MAIKTKLSLRDNITVFLLLYIQQNSHNLTNFVHKLSSFPFPYLIDVRLLTLLLAVFWFTSLPFFDCWCRCRCIWILNSEVLEGAELADNNITLKPLKLMDYSRRWKKIHKQYTTLKTFNYCKYKKYTWNHFF